MYKMIIFRFFNWKMQILTKMYYLKFKNAPAFVGSPPWRAFTFDSAAFYSYILVLYSVRLKKFRYKICQYKILCIFISILLFMEKQVTKKYLFKEEIFHFFLRMNFVHVRFWPTIIPRKTSPEKNPGAPTGLKCQPL